MIKLKLRGWSFYVCRRCHADGSAAAAMQTCLHSSRNSTVTGRRRHDHYREWKPAPTHTDTHRLTSLLSSRVFGGKVLLSDVRELPEFPEETPTTARRLWARRRGYLSERVVGGEDLAAGFGLTLLAPLLVFQQLQLLLPLLLLQLLLQTVVLHLPLVLQQLLLVLQSQELLLLLQEHVRRSQRSRNRHGAQSAYRMQSNQTRNWWKHLP